jgi:DNA-binding NarL/FixJ family response regulator
VFNGIVERIPVDTSRPAFARSARAIRVVLCDDHAVVRAGLERLLNAVEGIEVVATATDGHEGIEAAARLRPDVVLMDLSMPNVCGVEATRAILAAGAGTRVVVLTSFHHHARIANAMAAGASGYVLKDATPAELVDAIRSASALVSAA